MALFGKKNLRAQQEQQIQNIQIVINQCSDNVSRFPGIEIGGEKCTAEQLKVDVSRLVNASMLLDDESLLWWTVKVSALISDLGESLPVREVAKNLLWCKITAAGIVERHKEQVHILEILNRVDQAWIHSMEKSSKFKEATQLTADESDALLQEIA